MWTLRDCLREGDSGRERWNLERDDADYGDEVLSVPLSITLADGVKVSLNPPNLWLANLRGADLSGFDLSGAFLSGANLQDAVMHQCNLSGAHLILADLRKADLKGSDLSRANLLDANLSGADMRGTSLVGAQILRTIISDANFDGCDIHGVSVWGAVGAPKSQRDLRITTISEPTITVDDIEVGQFVYLLLHNEKIRNVLDTITSKVVLLLGRFTDDRKEVLNRLREELRHRNLSPVLFDFDPAANLDITDTVTLLARMARFVIADLTDPRSVQQELTLIATQVVVPIQPIILAGQQPWSMFTDLRRRSRGLLPVYEYVDIDDLLGGLQVHVVDPAENMRMELLHPT